MRLKSIVLSLTASKAKNGCTPVVGQKRSGISKICSSRNKRKPSASVSAPRVVRNIAKPIKRRRVR